MALSSLVPESVGLGPCLAAVGAVLITAFALWWRRRSKRERRMPPWAPGVSMWDMMEIMQDTMNNVFFVNEVFERKGGVSLVRMPLPLPITMIQNGEPELIRQLLAGDKSKGILEEDKPGFMAHALDDVTSGKSVVTRQTYGKPEDTMAWVHKALMPALSNTNLLRVLPLQHGKIMQLCGILDRHAEEGSELHVMDLISRFTLDALAWALFKQDFKVLEEPSGDEDSMDGHTFLREIDVAFREKLTKGMLPFRNFMFWDKSLARSKVAIKRINRFAYHVIDTYKSTHTQDEIDADTGLLAHLLRAPYKSQKDRIPDVIMMLIAGHETTAHSSVWILTELLKHPEKLAKARAELDEVNPSRGPLGQEEMSKLTYLNWVCKEGMRLWPIAGNGMFRMLKDDIEYKDYLLPKGAVVFTAGPYAGRKAYSDGDKFIPERWSPDHPEYKKNNDNFFGFSLGKRSCIGRNLANMQMKTVLGIILQNYDLTLKAAPVPEFFLTLKPHGAVLQVAKRPEAQEATQSTF